MPDADRCPPDAATAVHRPTRLPDRRVNGQRRAQRRDGDVDPLATESSVDLGARLLGPFALQVRGVPVTDWPSCRAKSLLRFLLLHRATAVARQTVLDSFWPEADAPAARNSLNVALHRLRRLLTAHGLTIDPVICADGHVRLNPQLTVWLDTERFDAGVDAAQALVRLGDGANTGADAMAAASAAGELARALELVRGDLVAHDRSEAWVEPFRRRFSDRHLLALHALAAYRLQQGDALACTELGHRMLLIDPCNEDAHRLLMSCYDRLSQPARVERQYRACVQALRDALGVAPHPRTTTLYRSLFQPTDRHCA